MRVQFKTVRVAPIAQSSIPNYVTAIGKISSKKAKSVIIDYHVAAKYQHSLEVSQPVHIYKENNIAHEFIGKVLSISDVKSSTNTVFLQAAIPNPSATIKIGDIYDIKQQVGVLKSQYLVPQEAIVPGKHNASIFVVKDGKALKRTVQLGPKFNRFIVIKGNVAVNDSVAIDKQGQLHDGQQVRIIQ